MNTILLFIGLGVQEIAIVVFAIIILFGGKKIPELMRGMGQGIKEFNEAKSTIKSELEDGMKSGSTDEKKN